MTAPNESGDRWRRIDRAFARVLETPPAERAAALDQACGGDPELRREVERLLEADEQARGFLDTPAGQIMLERTATGDSLAPSPDLLSVGHVLAGRYRILSVIGRGGMGAVYRAHDAVLGTEVAVKVLDRRRTRNPARLEAFRREVKLARLVSHPNVCRVHDIGEDAGAVFLTMEHVEGESLASRLRKVPLVDPPWCERVLRDVGRGLEAAHLAGVIHRDLKPENVLLRAGSDQAVVVDFGIAAQAVEGDDTESWVAGTRGYMSPEQLMGKPVDARSDVYALGILARQMATGHAPSDDLDADAGAQSDAVADRPIPLRLAPLISACLRSDPKDRPQDVSAALALLESPLKEALPSNTAGLPATRAGRSWKRRALVGAALLTLIAVGVGVSGILARLSRAPSTVILGPLDTTALGSDDAWLGDALRGLIRDELIDAWGLKARVEQSLSRSRDTALVDGRIWREDGRPQLSIKIRRGWGARERRASGRSLRDLAQKAAFFIVDASVPAAKRHPTAAELRAVGTRDADAWRQLRRARRAARMVQWSSAREMAQDAVRRDSDFAVAWIEIALTYVDSDSARYALLDKALAVAQRPQGLDPLSLLLLEFARCWRSNDVEGQYRAFDTVNRISVSDGDLLYGTTRVAIAYAYTADQKRGLALLEWIAEKWQNDAAAFKRLAAYHLQTDAGVEVDVALRHAKRAVALAPADGGSRMLLAQASLLAGDREQARSQVEILSRAEFEEKQMAIAPGDVNELFSLHMGLGQWDEAAADARRMFVGPPDLRLRAETNLALLDLSRGSYDEGLDGLHRVVAQYADAGMNSHAAYFSWYRCWYAYGLGRYAEAIAACRQARISAPSSYQSDLQRNAAASIMIQLAGAAAMKSASHRRRVLVLLRAPIAELPAQHPWRMPLEVLRRHALRDWAGVSALYHENTRYPQAVAIALYAADALDRLDRADEARGVYEWFASHPLAWRYPKRLPQVQRASLVAQENAATTDTDETTVTFEGTGSLDDALHDLRRLTKKLKRITRP